jgi:hypothetical protein
MAQIRRVREGARQGPQPANGGVKFTPTPDQQHAVACMVSVGTPHNVIARAIGVSDRTLYRHFEHELKNGKAEIHAAIGKSIASMALAGDKTMMIFFAKAQMGWRERTSVGFEDEQGRQQNPQQLFSIQISGGANTATGDDHQRGLTESDTT